MIYTESTNRISRLKSIVCVDWSIAETTQRLATFSCYDTSSTVSIFGTEGKNYCVHRKVANRCAGRHFLFRDKFVGTPS